MTISCYILEETWWSNREVPQVLPYFEALANSGDRINLSHRTFRNADDLDLALIADLAVPYHNDGKKKNVKLSFRGRRFLKNYEQLVRSLGLSGAYSNGKGKIELFPQRHRNK